MSTEYVNNITEALLLMEMPKIDPSLTKEHMQNVMADMNQFATTQHKHSSLIHGEYHKLVHPSGDIINYRHDGKNVKEISVIRGNTQVGISKNGGDIDHVHALMRHNIDTHGALATDDLNTPGSKKMWINFIKKNPDLKYKYHDYNKKISTVITPVNIDDHVNKIWGTSDDFEKIRLLAHK